jgi:hypothetical protein
MEAGMVYDSPYALKAAIMEMIVNNTAPASA